MADLLERLHEALASQYRVERELGAGGMAVVFLAQDLRHHRQVAIKVLRPELAAEIGPEQFLREIQTSARLSHPHILPLLDSGAAGDLLYYAMPFVEGESLRGKLSREKQLSLDDALQIAREVAGALDYAHSHGVVHRDIKPENILMQSGHAVVADFGIARAVTAAGNATISATGMMLGTPAYMSPEQASGSQEVDGRSDLYSLGCVVYEMLAGQPPFTGPTLQSLVHQHLTLLPRPVTELRPVVTGSVAAAVQRALAKTPADRFSAVGQFAEALTQRETGSLQMAATVAIATPVPASPAQERSKLAVLPFQNLSAEGAQAYFAGGLHDELLTQLAKVAALKVISRTSVMGYAGTSKSLKQIATELGVGSVVEGSVQVAGERLRVNVQLIDAATDEHLWAERYDRTLDDAFAIQSEIAQQVVAGVGLALTSNEQARLAAPPTENAEAYRLYLQGREYWTRPGYLRPNWEVAQQLYERALVLDPEFALARAALSQVHGAMYWWRYDPSDARAARQREQAEAALRLAPNLAQAHAAMGLSHYWGHREYRRALDEFAIALRGLPNDAELWWRIGAVNRRLGNWEAVFTAFEKATQLNPLDANMYYDLGGNSYRFVRRYAEAVHAYDRALSLAPDLYAAALARGWTYILWQGRLDALRAVLSRVPQDAELGGADVCSERADLLLIERNSDEILKLLHVVRADVFEGQHAFLPSALYAAWAHQMRGDTAGASAAFASACVRLESALHELPDDWRIHAAYGMALAGRREEALHEARWLQQSVVYREDAMDGLIPAEDRARILAQAGDADAALVEIERLLAGPSLLSVHTLRLDPRWDSIRDHPRFKSLLVKYGSGPPR